jgi:hypothetical protein
MNDRKLDDVTLAVFGDHDAGYGQTYSELDADESQSDSGSVEMDLDWADFNFGKKPK